MIRRIAPILVLSTVASLGLLNAPRAAKPQAPGLPSQPFNATNQPVIRFVKDPEPAPPLDAKDIFGNPVNKDDWPGKVVMVNFWATWCPPCRYEIPELLQLKQEFGDKLEIIGVSEDDDGPDGVIKFALSKNMSYPIVMATREIVRSYGGVPALPTTFLINTEGRVVTKHSGLYAKDAYDQEIRALLGMPTYARVETFVDTGQLFLKNAANASELPGVNFKGLTAEQKKHVLHRLNAESCTCGCDLTLSQCRVNDTGCPVSGDIAAQIIQEEVTGVKPAPAQQDKGTKTISE